MSVKEKKIKVAFTLDKSVNDILIQYCKATGHSKSGVVNAFLLKAQPDFIKLIDIQLKANAGNVEQALIDWEKLKEEFPQRTSDEIKNIEIKK